MSSPGAVQLGGIPSTTGLPTVRGFSNTSVIGLGVPFSQNDWPNPTRPVNAVLVDFIDQSIIGFVIPFNQTDWTNPQQPRQSSLSFSSSNTTLSTAVQNPFFSNTTFVVPRGPTSTEPGFVDQAIWALVIPFAQTDWPNPVRSPVTPIEFHDTFSRPVTQNPFRQNDWPNPRGVFVPVSALGSINGPITVVPSLPFGTASYDLPPRTHRPNQGWTDSYPNRIAVVQVPFFSTTTFDVPRGPTATEPGFTDQSIFAFTIPFSQTNWPNPTGIQWSVGRLGSIDGIIVDEGQPFYQTDWPNPATRLSTALGWIDNYPNRATVIVIPFKQNDWNNPQTKNALPVYWIDTYPNRSSAAPFAQLNWPNPQRAVVLPFWWTDSYNRTPVAIGNPFSQKDWPNPKGPSAIHAVGIIPYATALIPLPPPPPPSTEPEWRPFLVSVGKLMGLG